MTLTQINGLPCPAVLYFLQWFLSRTLQKQDKDELFTSDWFRISKPPTFRFGHMTLATKELLANDLVINGQMTRHLGYKT